MTKITDEHLSAFLDGALPEEEMNRITNAAANDPSVSSRLAALHDTDEALKDLFAAVDSKPIRQETLSLIDEALGEKQETEKADNVVAFSRPVAKTSPQNWWPQAVAASIALVIGFSGGSMFNGSPPSSDFYAQTVGPVATDTALFTALSRGESGTPIQTDGAAITPTASFATDSGYCREFELSAGSKRSRNIACKEGNSWTVVASVAAPQTDLEGGYSTASNSGAVIDTMIMQMMQGDVLTLEDEQKLIQQGWQ